MKFEKVIPAYRKGKKIRRKCRNEDEIMDFRIVKSIGKYGSIKEGVFWKAVVNALLEADDWEIVKEKKKIKLRDLTEKELKQWKSTFCSSEHCKICPLHNIPCGEYVEQRINNKDLYSDKFLDQEIEIEE